MSKTKGAKHTSRTSQYAAYKTQRRWAKNRERKLEKYVKNNPNDLLAKARLKKGNFEYRRKPPLSWKKTWRPAQITLAQNLAKGGANGNDALKYIPYTKIY